MTAKNTGPKMVVKMNHFDRTRSTYSRLMTTQSLSMACHPHFDARGADFLEEDLVQRRLYQFEPLHFRARLDEPAEQGLRVGVLLERDLEEPVRIVHALDHLVVAEHAAHELGAAVGERECDVVAAVLVLHVRDGAVEHLLAARDDAHRIAEALGVVHEVRREDHSLAALLEVDDGVLQ